MPAAEPPLPPRPPGPTDVFAAPLPPFPAMIVSMELNETEAAGAALTKTPRATPPSRPFDPEVGPPEPARARTPLIVLLIMFAVAPYQTEIPAANVERSEEHTSELQSPDHLVCRLLLEKKKKHHK